MSSLTLDFEPRWRAKADGGYWYIARDMQVVRAWGRGKEGLPFKTILTEEGVRNFCHLFTAILQSRYRCFK